MARAHSDQKTIGLEFDDFKDGAAVERLLAVKFEEVAEVLATLAYTVQPGSPGKYYGPPEDCYPADPPDVDSIEVTATVGGTKIELWEHLTDKKQGTLIEEVCEAADEHRGEEAEARADYEYDRMKDEQLERGE